MGPNMKKNFNQDIKYSNAYKRFQQRVICNSKCYSFRFTLFSIVIFVIKANFAHFLFRLNVQDRFLLGIMISMSFKICFIIAYPANPQILTKNNGRFGVVWMSRCIVQLLMFVCRLNVQVCGQFTSRQAHLKAQKGNAFFIELMYK